MSEVQIWVQSHDDDPMVISVSDPAVKSGGIFGKKKTLYAVRESSRSSLTSVQRTYKDFVSLQETLNSRFRGACIPPAPPEKMLGSTTTEDFITKRMHLLESFLQAIVDNPFLRTDTCFNLFISSPEDFDKALKHFDKSSESEGSKMWKKALEGVTAPDDPEKLLKDIDKELDSILKSLRALKDVAKTQVASIVKYAEATRALADKFEYWQAREEANVSVLRGVMTRPDGTKAILAHQLQAIVQGTGATASVLELEYGASQMELIILDAIRFEIAQAERWKERVSETLLKFKAHAKAGELVKSFQVQLGTITSKPHSEKQITLVTDKLNEAKQLERNAFIEVNDYSKGLLVVELERYRKQRTMRIENMSALLARIHLRGANMIKCAWDGTGLEFMEGSAPAFRQNPMGSGGGSSFFKRRSFTRTPSGRLRVKGAETNLEEELRREANTLAPARNLAIHEDEHKVTLKAKKDYAAKKKDELDLREGETVTAVRIDDEMWYATNGSGKSGLVPSSYVGVPTDRSSISIPSPTHSTEEKDNSERSSSGIPTGTAPPPPPPPGINLTVGLPPPGPPPLPPHSEVEVVNLD